MTPATDDDALEAAFEAFLAGRGVPPAAEGLVAFADGVRATSARPPRPSAALADLLATGLLTDQSSAPAPRAVRSPRRSTRRMFLAFFAKFAAAGVAAKAAVVGGVVVVGVSTAGFTGALPDGIQHDFASVVDTATPLTAPDPVASTTPPATPPTTGITGTEVTGPSGTTTAPVSGSDEGTDDGTTATTPTTAPARPTSTHPDNFGGTVSSLAHERNDARRSAASGSSTAPAGPTSDDADEHDDSDHDGSTSSTSSTGTSGGGDHEGSSSGSHGKGHGNG